MNNRLVLYTGTLCHLCDQAKTLIYPLLPYGCRLNEINIDEDADLKTRYGVSIPVVAIVAEDGSSVIEKGWPFTAGQVKRLLAQL